MSYRYIILLLSLILTWEINAQQTPVYSQYMFDKFLVNPATAGATAYTFVNIAAREQYHGFVNSPRTFSLTAQSRILDDSYIRRKLIVKKNSNKASRDTRVGFGGHLYSDRNGLVTKTGLGLTYAYHINFDNKFQLSMGITGSGFQYKLDDSDAYLFNPDDPLLNTNKKTFFVPDASVGLYITNSKFYSGISITDLLGSGLKLGKDNFKENYRTLRHYSLLAGYKFNMENSFALEPSFLARSTRMITHVDFNIKAIYQEAYWLGLSYRTNKTLIAMAGLNIEMFYFGYAFDASMGAVSNYSTGSHEVIFGVRIGDSSSRRFRWVRKDAIEYDL